MAYYIQEFHIYILFIIGKLIYNKSHIQFGFNPVNNINPFLNQNFKDEVFI